MRTKNEIASRAELYKQKLALAIEEKALAGNRLSPDIDLIIFSLVDKIEALFWVLELPLPDDDLLDRFTTVSH